MSLQEKRKTADQKH